MHRYKKLTAFIAALLIGASAAAMPITGASADEAETTTSAADDTAAEENSSQETATEAPAEDSGTKVSGDFTYSINHDGLVCIEDCSFTGADLVIPDKLFPRASAISPRQIRSYSVPS